VTCEHCGQRFEAHPSSLLRGHSRFCSLACRYKAMRGENHPNWKGRIEKTCVICGKGFAVPQTLKDAILCSLACKHEYQSQHYSGDKASNWQGGAIKTTCEICGKTFLVIRGSRHRRFCSRQCVGQWWSEYQRGVNNPNWQGGKSFEPYTDIWTESFRMAIRERDNHTCAICRLTGENVHHIDYDKMNTISENCITLCNSCHATTGSHRDYWQAALHNLMQRRMIICQP
jgi:endogenous inhibitor of DNA gyrase (YacG/DUF329 family)